MKTINIYEIISQKLQDRSTGALFFLNANKKLIQTYFVDGQVVSIKSCNFTGIQAVKELVTMRAVKFQFHDGAESYSKDTLPETSKLLEIIDSERKYIHKTRLLDDNTEAEFRELFINYVGPIADVIFDEQVGKCNSGRDLVLSLSSYIDSKEDRKKFIGKLS